MFGDLGAATVMTAISAATVSTSARTDVNFILLFPSSRALKPTVQQVGCALCDARHISVAPPHPAPPRLDSSSIHPSSQRLKKGCLSLRRPFWYLEPAQPRLLLSRRHGVTGPP